MKRTGIEASIAIAKAVQQSRADVIAAYPITPQTHIVEQLAEYVANGELEGQYVPVESEHSAMSACVGSSAVGARTFTATAGVGLELMHEVLYLASSMRMPIVMAVANRALSGPLSIWGDHSDVMATRDCGWIQIFAENAQQAYDQIFCAFKIAETESVLFPTMVNIDGFHLSHVIEPLELIEQSRIDSFLPECKRKYILDPEKPITMGAFAMPAFYSEVRKAQDVALRNSKKVIFQVWEEFYKLTGRKYLPIETYHMENAEVLLITMGSYSETAMAAVDELRGGGLNVGLARIRLWRPFPFEELSDALSKAKTVIVLDRAISYGGTIGPVCSEIKAALYAEKDRPKIIGFTGGLGGRDISASTFKTMVKHAVQNTDKLQDNEVHMIEVRE